MPPSTKRSCNGINAAFRALDEEKERKKAEEIRKTRKELLKTLNGME